MRRLATIAIMLMAVTLPTGPGLGRAQSPSLSARACLSASVEIDSRDVFVYRYTLEMAPRVLFIWRMTIDISLPAGASRPSAFGVAHGPGYFVAELSVQKEP